ncbi:MAG: FtsK/SpoIIIE domain-containing protein, partial [Ilumatobacteraceae bacterium]
MFDGELVSVGTSVLHVTADPGTPDQEGFDPEAFDPEAFDPAFDPAAFDRDAGPRTTSMPGGVVVRRGRRRARAPGRTILVTTTGSRATAHDRRCRRRRRRRPRHRRRPDGLGRLAGATAGLAVGVVLAVVLHQPLMLLMGAVGVLMSGGTWLGRRVRRRRRRRARAEAAAAAADRLAGLLAVRRARVAERCRADQPGLVDALRVVTRSTSAMWQRRPDHGDAFTAVAGVGDGWAAGAGAGGAPLALERVPVCADLGPGARVACAGPGADAMIRSLLVQLAVTTGPADWQLLVVGDRPDRWSWLTGLPHLVCTDDAAVVHDDVVLGDRLGTGRPGDHRHLLVLTDATGSLAVRTSALRRLLHARPDAALLVAAPAAGDVPAACTQVWITTSDGRVKVDGTPPSPNDRPIGPGTFGPWHLHGLGPAGARLAVGALAPWSDPEAPDDHERRLADAVDLDRLWRERGVRLEPAGVLAHWRRGRDANGAIADAAPIGSAADGTVDLDLVRDGPHGLIAGTTGSGKSELLRTIVLSSAIAQPPDRLAFVLVDFKGGATFDDLARLPHVVGVVTDLEPRLAERVLRSLRAEVTAREHLLRSHGCADLDTARRRLDVPVVARLVIVVDEFAALALEHPELLHGLVDIARRGRSLGIHLLLATQRPGGVVSDEIRTNTDLRIALRLHEPSEAIDVVGDAAPASIRRSSAGRAVVRLGPGELVTFQTASGRRHGPHDRPDRRRGPRGRPRPAEPSVVRSAPGRAAPGRPEAGGRRARPRRPPRPAAPAPVRLATGGRPPARRRCSRQWGHHGARRARGAAAGERRRTRGDRRDRRVTVGRGRRPSTLRRRGSSPRRRTGRPGPPTRGDATSRRWAAGGDRRHRRAAPRTRRGAPCRCARPARRAAGDHTARCDAAARQRRGGRARAGDRRPVRKTAGRPSARPDRSGAARTAGRRRAAGRARPRGRHRGRHGGPARSVARRRAGPRRIAGRGSGRPGTGAATQHRRRPGRGRCRAAGRRAVVDGGRARPPRPVDGVCHDRARRARSGRRTAA